MAGSLGDMIVRVGADIDGFERAMGTVSSRLRAIDNQAARAFSGFDRIGGRLVDVGTTLTASLTAPMAIAGAAALKTAGDFELSMNKIKAFGDIGGGALESLRAQALKLGADTEFSAQQAADAMVVFASAGMKADQIYAAMPGTLALAAAGQLKVGEAATITKDILGQFQLKAADSAHVADVLAQASADASSSLGDMATTLQYVGSTGKGFGQSLEEMTASIVALDAAGLKGERAGTGLRGVIGSLAAPSKEAAKYMTDLGISISDSVTGKVLPLSNIMEQFRQGLARVNGDAERSKIIFEVFGREAGNAAQVLINTGGPALSAYRDKLVAVHDTAQQMAKTINSGLNFALDQFKGSVETAGIAIGTALIPSATRILAVLTDLVNNAVLPAFQWFSKLPQPIQDGALAMAAIVAVMGPMAVGLGLVIQSIGTIGTAMTSAAGVFTMFGSTAIPGAIAAMTTFATVTIPAAAAAVWAFATTALPAAVAQVGLLSRALLVDAAASVAAFATTAIPSAIAAVMTFATTALPAAIAAVIEFATVSIPAAITSLTTFSVTTVPGAIASLGTFASTAVPAAIASLRTMAASALPAVIGALSTLGVAALAAAAAFAGWKLGQWAYEQIPGVKALGDSVGDLILKIPGVTFALEKLSGASAATERAQGDLAYSTDKLETALKRKGIVVDKTGLSTEQYAGKLKEAAKQAGLAGTAQDTARAKIEAAKRQIAEADAQTKIYNQALAEMGKQAKGAGDQHSEARVKVREFKDGIPAAIIQEYENKIRTLTREIARTTVEHHLAAAAGKDFAGQLDRNIERAAALSEELARAANQKMPTYVAGLGKIGAATGGLTEDLKVAVKAGKDQFEGLEGAAKKSGEGIAKSGAESAQKTKTAWDQMGQQVSTIITDTGKKLADKLLNLFKPSAENKRLDEEAAKLRTSLTERETEWTKYAAGVMGQMEEIKRKNAESLAQETADLQKALDDKRLEYEAYRESVAAQLGEIAQRHSAAVDKETGELIDGLAKREDEYEAFASKVPEQLAAIRTKYQDQLADELRTLQANLADRQEQYDDFVADAQTSMARLREDERDSIGDKSRDTGRNIADKQKQYKRDEEDTNTRIQRLLKSGKKANDSEIIDLRQSLKRKREDLDEYVKRQNEDLADYTEEVKRRARQQEQDLRASLDRKARDHAQYVGEIRTKEKEATDKANENIKREEGALRLSLDTRRIELEKYRLDTQGKINLIIADHAAAQKKEEEALKSSLANRTAEYEKYKIDAAAKMDGITSAHDAALAKELGALQKSMEDKKAEWEKYKTDTKEKLDALAAEHQSFADRLKAALGGALVDMGEAITRWGAEFMVGKLFKWFGDLVTDIIPGAARALASLFGIGTQVAGGAAGAAATSALGGAGDLGAAAGSAGGGAGATAGGALSTAASITGIVTGIVSAVSSVIANFQLAKQETTLNAIENSTRYVKIWFGEQSQNALWCLQKMTERSEYIVADLDAIGSYASEQLAWLQRIGAATEAALTLDVQRMELAPAGGVNITLSNITFGDRGDVDYLIDQLGRRMREAGQTI